MKTVVVTEYNPLWAGWYEQLYATIWPAVSDVALALEHVGSTAVPGLAAKPVVDLDVIVPDAGAVRVAIDRLSAMGYRHRGDLGIAGRETFHAPPGPIRHHLYVCLEGCAALCNHLVLRDHLRRSPRDRDAYAALKRRLAAAHPDSMDAYVAGKTAFILRILENYMKPGDVTAILQANQQPGMS